MAIILVGYGHTRDQLLEFVCLLQYIHLSIHDMIGLSLFLLIGQLSVTATWAIRWSEPNDGVNPPLLRVRC